MESILIAPVLWMGHPGGRGSSSSGTKFLNIEQEQT